MGRANIDERTVIRVWERGAFDAAPLQALGLRIVYRGTPSDAGGPDFQDAVLSFGGRDLVRGDVEFHVRASDWSRHGHHQDRNYNNVILHVVWEDDAGRTARQDGVEVPILGLRTHAYLSARAGQQSLLDPPCASLVRVLSTEEVVGRVRGAALRRLRDRATALESELAVRPADDVAFTALLESMGYASNRETFRALADVAPYRFVMSIPPDLRHAVLLDAARLGPLCDPPAPARLPAGSWRLTRIRPGNHPAGRIAAVGTLLERFSPSLALGLADLVFESRRPSDIGKALVVSGAPGTSLGVGRAHEVAVSVVLPLTMAMEPARDEPENVFAGYPAPPDTRWTRAMTAGLRDSGHEIPVRGAADHQGLHAIYTRHCRSNSMRGCPLCSPETVT